MELTLEEAVRGVTKEIRFRLWKSVTFATVAVQNQVHSADLSDLSWFWSGADASGILPVQQTCPHCQGRGTLIKDPCTNVMVMVVLSAAKRCPLKSRRSGHWRPHPSCGRR